jgi:hypothetical protein
MSFRVSPEFKAKLDEWSERSGRSIAQEIELRLMQSDRDERIFDQTLENICGSPRFAGLMKLLVTAALEIGPQAAFSAAVRQGKPGEAAQTWMSDPYAYDQVVQAIIAALDHFRPEGDRVPAQFSKARMVGGLDLNAVMRALGEGSMRSWLDAIDNPENAPTARLQQEGAKIRKMMEGAECP